MQICQGIHATINKKQHLNKNIKNIYNIDIYIYKYIYIYTMIDNMKHE